MLQGTGLPAVGVLCWERLAPLPLGFLDVSGISLWDSSNASVWPSLPSPTEPTPTAVTAAGPEDVCSSSGSHERAGEWPTPTEAFREGPWAVGKAAPSFSAGREAGFGVR